MMSVGPRRLLSSPGSHTPAFSSLSGSAAPTLLQQSLAITSLAESEEIHHYRTIATCSQGNLCDCSCKKINTFCVCVCERQGDSVSSSKRLKANIVAFIFPWPARESASQGNRAACGCLVQLIARHPGFKAALTPQEQQGLF